MGRKLIAIAIILLLIVAIAQGKKKVKQQQKDGKKKHSKHHHHEAPHYLTPDSLQFWVNALLATFLSVAGGFCSGMTVGLNSLSTLNLEIMQKSSDPFDKKMADRILGVIHDHHLFLVTLLVGNAIVLQSLPLVIHLIMPDWAAILFSTVIVLIVAEVVPMSLSTGSRKYIIAYYGAPLVALMIKVFYPICYPIARGLDKLLQRDHEERILRQDFLTFVNDQKKNFLEQLEIQFINQIMNYKNKTVKEFMINLKEDLVLEENQIIDEDTIKQISQKEISFIPVYRKEPNNIVGYAITKEIIMNYLVHQNEDKQPLKKLVQGRIIYKAVKIYSDAVAIQALEVIESTKSKVLFVCDEEKHHTKGSQKEAKVISVYTSNEWTINDETVIPIGFITLNQILHEMADFRTTTLKTLHRKLSRDPEEQEQK